MTIDTALDQVRLEIGDRDMSNPLFTDDEIQYYIDAHGGTNVLLSAADCCDALATRFASNIDFNTDTLAVKKFQRAEWMAKRADTLRDRAVGIGQIGSVKVDGYSQDIDNEETNLIDQMPVDPEIPRYGPSWASDLARQTDYHPGEGGNN